MEVSILADNLKSIKSQLELELKKLECSYTSDRIRNFTYFLESYISSITFQQNTNAMSKQEFNKCKAEIKSILHHLDKSNQITLRKLFVQIEFIYLSLENILNTEESDDNSLDDVIYFEHIKLNEKLELEKAAIDEPNITNFLNHLLELIDNNVEQLKLSLCPSESKAECIPQIFSLELIPDIKQIKDQNLVFNYPKSPTINPFQLQLM